MAGLCLLAGSGWLLESARPEAQSTYTTNALGCLMAAGVAGLPLLRTGHTTHVAANRPLGRSTVLGSLAILTAPASATLVAGRFVHADDATLALSLTPVVVAVATAALEDAQEGELTARLWPGLAGVAGLLLLLPQPSLASWRYLLALACLPLLMGLGGVFTAAVTREQESAMPAARLQGTMAALLLAAALLGGLAFFRKQAAADLGTCLAISALDGMLALLTLLVLQRLGSVRWAAQFMLIPLLALLEGVALLRPVLDGRSVFAFVLLVVSGGYLLFGGEGK